MADAEIDAVRGILASHPRPADLSERRKRLDALGAEYPLPADVRVEPVGANGVAAEWTTTPEANPAHVIMFLHGGGYISGSIASHRHMIAQAGREARARTLAIGYRLAPEHPFPAALKDAISGYRFLLAQNFAPENIAIAGESAGGGLALATLASLRDAGIALPACAWCSFALVRRRTKIKCSLFVPRLRMRRAARGGRTREGGRCWSAFCSSPPPATSSMRSHETQRGWLGATNRPEWLPIAGVPVPLDEDPPGVRGGDEGGRVRRPRLVGGRRPGRAHDPEIQRRLVRVQHEEPLGLV